MKAQVMRIVLIGMLGHLLAASGCYSCVTSLAKCAAQHKTNRSMTCDFQPDSKLLVRNELGPVVVSGGERTDCRIAGEIYIRAPRKREAQEIGEQVHIVAEPNEGTLLIKLQRPPLKDNRYVWAELNIMIPSQAHVDCETEFGEIRLTDIKGDARAQTQFGGITGKNIRGPLDLKTEFGRVTCQRIVTDSIVARSQLGSIDISCSSSCPAELAADVRTECGSIRFHAPPGFRGSFDLGTDFGSTWTKMPIVAYGKWTHERKNGTTGEGEGNLRLHTQFGSVELR